MSIRGPDGKTTFTMREPDLSQNSPLPQYRPPPQSGLQQLAIGLLLFGCVAGCIALAMYLFSRWGILIVPVFY